MSKIEISRIQNRRGLFKDLPQPLNPGELGYCVDTGQLFIGSSSEFSDQVLRGSEISRLSPADGVNIANTLKNRVMLCDIAFTPEEIGEEQVKQLIVDANLYEGIDIGGVNVEDTIAVKYFNIDDVYVYRAYVGIIYRKFDSDSDEIIIDDEFDAIVDKLKDVETEEGTNLFVMEPYNVSSASGSYFQSNGVYTNGRFNIELLQLSDYEGITWAINHIYINSVGEELGLVNISGNIEVVTDASFENFFDRDMREVAEFITELSYSPSPLDMPSGAELFIEHGERSFNVEYSVSMRNNEVEVYSGISTIQITLVRTSDTEYKISYDDNLTETEHDGKFAIIPYYDDTNSIVKFKYINTISVGEGIVGTITFRSFSLQWSNF